MLALTAATLFTPSERVDLPLVLVEDGRVVEVTSCASREVPAGARLADFGDAVLSPGFIDIHIHGSAGHDVMEPDSGALPAVERLLAQHGVTSYFPTTVTAPVETILAALERLALVYALVRWESTWKGHSSAIRDAVCILRNSSSVLRARSLKISGKRRVAICAS